MTGALFSKLKNEKVLSDSTVFHPATPEKRVVSLLAIRNSMGLNVFFVLLRPHPTKFNHYMQIIKKTFGHHRKTSYLCRATSQFLTDAASGILYDKDVFMRLS